MFTAVLGSLIFSELLPGLWWLGAAMLVAGSVIVGRNVDDGGKKIALDDDVVNTGVGRSSNREHGDEDERNERARSSDELVALEETEREGLLRMDGSRGDEDGNQAEEAEEGGKTGPSNVNREL